MRFLMLLAALSTAASLGCSTGGGTSETDGGAPVAADASGGGVDSGEEPVGPGADAGSGSDASQGLDAGPVVVTDAYRLTNRGITTEAPSVVRAAVHVHRVSDGAPLKDLRVDNFEVLEDGAKVTRSESFLDLEPLANIPYTLKTVLSLDVSSSLTLADIDKVKETARNLVVDPATGKSRLLKGQQVAIYTFDDVITLRIDFTTDPTALVNAINGITRGGPSTNLYGAIQTGLSRWPGDSYSLTQIVNGAMILVTDGNDTAGLVTKEQAAAARGDKQLFVVPVGSEVDRVKLEEIAGADHVFPANDYSQLQSIMAQVTARMATFADGLYFLYYATPKRSGTHTITISLIGNTNTGADSKVTGTFSANGFTSVVPQIIQTGPAEVRVGSPITWEVRTRWSNDPANYGFATNDPTNALSSAPLGTFDDGKGQYVRFSATGQAFGARTVTITDKNHSKSITAPLEAKTSVVPALKATAGFRQVSLTWGAVTDATGYVLTWNDGTNPDVAVSLGKVTSYTHTGLSNGVTYTYRLASIIGGVPSAPSSAVTATPTLPSTTVLPVAIKSGAATVTWNVVGPASGYRVYNSVTPGITKATPFTPVSGAGFLSMTSLDLTRRQYFAVTAVDSTGFESALSNEAAPPAVPTSAAVSAAQTSAVLTWTAAPGATGYRILYAAGGNPYGGSSVAAVASPATVTGLSTGVTYSFVVQATNTDGTADSDVVSSLSCQSGYGVCNGQCVNFATTTNCGRCGNACATGASCASGACACPGTQQVCNGACVDTQTNPSHCGSCGAACPNLGELCVQGSCACPTGYGVCNGRCVDLRTVSNCGSCGNACATGASCTNGACACPTNQAACSGACRSITTTSDCGRCGNACPIGASCTNGACACPAGEEDCSGTCRATQTDYLNCGTCGNVCTVNRATCSAGTCGCAQGQIVCSNTCVDTTTDTSNCGSCGKVCTQPGAYCINSVCQCHPLQTVCNGACVFLNQDDRNCGACGNACGANQVCGGGKCLDYLSGSSQPMGPLDLDATNVYYVNPQGIGKLPKAGGTNVNVVSYSSYIADIKVSGTALLYSTYNSGTVVKGSTSGGATTTIAQSEPQPGAMAIDSTNVYWVRGGSPSGIVKAPIAGGVTPTVLTTPPNQVFPIATNGTYVFYAYTNGEVYRVSVNGGSPFKLGTVTGGVPTGLAATATEVFVAAGLSSTSATGVVSKLPVNGGTPVVLASGLTYPSAIQVDGTNVYFGERSSTGALKRVATTGGTVTVLASGTGGVNDLAIDATYVYFSAGILYRVPK